MGLFNKAKEDYTRAINLDHDHHFYYDNRAELYVYMHEYALAKKDLTESIRLNPNKSPKTFFNRGFVNKELNLLSEACSDFKIALELGHMDAVKMIIESCKK